MIADYDSYFVTIYIWASYMKNKEKRKKRITN